MKQTVKELRKELKFFDDSDVSRKMVKLMNKLQKILKKKGNDLESSTKMVKEMKAVLNSPLLLLKEIIQQTF